MATQTKSTNSPSSRLLWRGLIPLLLIVAGAWFIFRPAAVTENRATNLEPAPRTGHPAPDFTLQTLDGQRVSLSDFQGRPVIVNFWATWCGPCRIEMPHLQESYTAHQGDEVVVLGVNLTSLDDPGAIPGFVDEFKLTFPIVLDETGAVRSTYQLLGQPASVFIDRDGIIHEYFQGPINQQFIEETLAEIL